MHHSAISRHLKTVEQWTGAILIARSGRGVSLTEDGWRYHEKLAAALDALADATLSFTREHQQGKLVIWSRPGIAMVWLVPRLAALGASDPALQLELKPSHVAPDLSKHDVDLFIQYGSNYEPELVLPPDVAAVEFVRSPIIPVASPEYIASSAPVRRPEDFLDHQLIDDEGDGSWTPWFSCFGIESDRKKHAGPRFWYPHLALDAARRSHGVLLSTRFMAQADLDAGRLVEVVGPEGPFNSGQTGSYWLLGRTADWNEGRCARFREWIVSATAEHRDAVDPSRGKRATSKDPSRGPQSDRIEGVRGGA